MKSELQTIVRLAEKIPAEPHRSSLLNNSGVIRWHQLYTNIDQESDFYVLRPDLPRLAHSRSSIDGKVYPHDHQTSAFRSIARATGIINGHDILVSQEFERVSRSLSIYRDLIASDWELMAYFHQYWYEGTVTVDGTPYVFSPDISFIRANIGRSDGTTGGMGKNRVAFTARPHLDEVTSTGEPADLWEGQQPLPIVDFGDSNEDNMIRVLEAIADKSS